MSPHSKLSRTRIIEEAFLLVSKEGLDNLSMRKLANHLEVEAMSLYNHVKNKDDVIDAITDHLMGKVSYAKAPDWQTSLINRALALKEVLTSHPWGIIPLMARFHTKEHILHDYDQTIGILIESGFSYQEADQIMSSVNAYIYGYLLTKLYFPIEEASYQEVAEDYKDTFDNEKLPYLKGMSEAISKGDYNGVTDFKKGLMFLLQGITYTYKEKGETV